VRGWGRKEGGVSGHEKNKRSLGEVPLFLHRTPQKRTFSCPITPETHAAQAQQACLALWAWWEPAVAWWWGNCVCPRSTSKEADCATTLIQAWHTLVRNPKQPYTHTYSSTAGAPTPTAARPGRVRVRVRVRAMGK